MRKILAPLAALSLAAWTPSQCCLGAQDVTADSHGGRYRVQAVSQTGTGPEAHGPYRFRFRTLRVAADGSEELLGEFERTWDTKAHCALQLLVSPTGNGFLLGSSLDAGIRFFAPDGTVLREVVCSENHTLWPLATTPHPLQIRLYSTRAQLPMRQTLVWLPLCHTLGPEVQRGSRKGIWTEISGAPRWQALQESETRWLMSMLTWSPARGRQQLERARQLVALLADTDGRETAAKGLLELGLSAEPVLREALAQKPSHADSITAILAEITARLCGHAEPWRHRELLEALLSHPEEELARTAQARLRSLDE